MADKLSTSSSNPANFRPTLWTYTNKSIVY